MYTLHSFGIISEYRKYNYGLKKQTMYEMRNRGVYCYGAARQLMKGDEPMKRKLFLTTAALVCALNVTACGRRDEPGAKYPETTAVTTRRETTRRETTRTEPKTQSRVGEDVSEIASDAVRGAGELASDAVAKGKELVTDAASDVRDAVDDRRGEGDYEAGDNGKVQENGATTVTAVR